MKLKRISNTMAAMITEITLVKVTCGNKVKSPNTSAVRMSGLRSFIE